MLTGLVTGWVRPLCEAQADYLFERTTPRAPKRFYGMRSAVVLDLIDVGFHGSGASHADPTEVALAHSPLPPGARRDERDGLVTIRWIEDLTDEPALDRACQAHEDWLDHHFLVVG